MAKTKEKTKESRAEIAARIANECSERLFHDEVMKAISYAANRGFYVVDWRLQRSLRGKRIPQNFQHRLEEMGFDARIVYRHRLIGGVQAVGLRITWGVP